MSVTLASDTDTYRLRLLLAYIYENFVKTPQSPDDVHPLYVLDKSPKKSPRATLEQILSGIDLILSGVDAQAASLREGLDEKLVRAGAMPIAEYRTRYSKSLRSIVKRGSIKSRREYDFVKNVMEQCDQSHYACDHASLQSMLDSYEIIAAAQKE